MPRFSIIMPTFRREHVIYQTVETVSRQTFTDWELIIIDNAGSHYSFEDPRIRYFVFDKLPSAAGARNFGISFITGELTCFLDDDDIMYPHYLATFDTVFKDSRVMMAHCGMLTGRDQSVVNFSYATPEVVVRSAFVKPAWESTDCHDQKYFQKLVTANQWKGEQIVKVQEILVKAMSDGRGGLRDPRGRF